MPSGLLGVLLLLNGGCRAADQISLRWPVDPPPPPQGEQPVIWVALAARLGPAVGAPPVLRAASGSLTLEDGSGQRLTATTIPLRWRWEPLPRPFLVRRRVLGPFASHESARAAARPWEALGLRPVIARPLDWEVWAPADAPDPPGRASRLVERREVRRLTLASAGP
ncbi:MAG: hypothetical protein ACK6BG_11905 [Cyanobacteriota bacterium]